MKNSLEYVICCKPPAVAKREPLYRVGSDLVLDTEGKTPEELAGEINGKLL
ncbi:MAG: hypothetical protein WGN25_18785 [Candidatus Electrothrix sp. GW3-4]|uniref:hypothetical protein n=1 Tax=Candidatus Electrothrix sp. GW3-4 TaxID=3126740 RepID=UPI0030D3369A